MAMADDDNELEAIMANVNGTPRTGHVDPKHRKIVCSPKKEMKFRQPWEMRMHESNNNNKNKKVQVDFSIGLVSISFRISEFFSVGTVQWISDSTGGALLMECCLFSYDFGYGDRVHVIVCGRDGRDKSWEILEIGGEESVGQSGFVPKSSTP